jgi:SAM-dependent methyltransferase
VDGAPASARECPDSEAQRLATIAEFYDHATADYRHWSAALHMHFGCWRWPLSPFDRAGMVERLSLDVLDRLDLSAPVRADLASAAAPISVLDLGCGVGTTARLLARRNPAVRVLGASLSPAQVAHGNRLSAALGLGERVELRVGDYRATACASASMAGAYAIESACYDPEHGAGLIREAARVLAPGARLVVADAFRRRPDLSRLAARVEQNMLAGWRLPQLSQIDRFTAQLRQLGFEVTVEDLSWRVGPSLAQVPLVALDFRVRAGRPADPHRRGNASASVWGLVYALLFPRCLGYFLITATRR